MSSRRPPMMVARSERPRALWLLGWLATTSGVWLTPANAQVPTSAQAPTKAQGTEHVGAPSEAARTRLGDMPLGGERLRARAALPPLKWQPQWARFGAGHLTTALLFGGAALTATWIEPLESTRRRGGIGFDDDVRSVLRADSVAGRFLARDTSDALLSLLMTYPYFVDALATAWWFRGSAEVARQMSLINLEAMAITAGVQGITNVVASRERPYGQDCGGAIEGDTVDCVRARRYRSFFSGHAALAFTSAGLICSHHMQLRLLGPGPGDAITCTAAMVAAGSVASLRVVGDMHYASDIAVGAGVGLLVGLGVPFLHYQGRLPTLELGKGDRSTQISLVPSGAGASLVGRF